MYEWLKKTFTLTTVDDIVLSLNLYSKNTAVSETLLIIAPGFSQHKNTRPMYRMAEELVEYQDTLVIDFRGTGKSKGVYTFGAKEYLDLYAVLTWAKSRYEKILLLGLSLGGYHSLRAAYLLPNLIDKLLLVSCPTRVEDVVTSGAALLHPFYLLFRKSNWCIAPQYDLIFRWGWPFTDKPDLRKLAKSIHVPAAFLVAGKDTLVYPSLTQAVYHAYSGRKSWTCFPEGFHAEAMFLQNPKKFLAWVRTHSTPL